MLNIGSAVGGDFLPFVKFNAKADKWFVRKDGEDVEIQRPTFVADIANIKTGWFLYQDGLAPQKTFDPDLATPAPKPGDNYRRGFQLNLYSDKFFGGLVEFASASRHVSDAISEIYAQYTADKDAHPGELPVVSCTGATAMKDKQGTNYKPTFAIVKWAPRPDGMDVTEQSAAPAPSPASPPSPTQHVAPPSDPLTEAEF